MVIMVVAVMSIMMTVAVQTVEFEMRREREAELIFRGQQYVEGIRLFKQKYGRYPMRLQELWEADPRVLRQKWSDPMTGSEQWGLVFLGQEGQELGGGSVSPGRRPTPTPTPVFSSRSGAGGAGERIGPIIGVHSLATGPSIKVYEGRTSYEEWKFVYRENEGAPQAPGGGGDPNPDVPYGYPTPRPPQPGPTGTPGY